MVLSNEPFIRYRDFLTYSTFTQPKTCKGLTPLGNMDDAILTVGNRFQCFHSSHEIKEFLIEPWQHAGLVGEGS